MSTENTTRIDNKDKQIIKGAEDVYSFSEQWKTSCVFHAGLAIPKREQQTCRWTPLSNKPLPSKRMLRFAVKVRESAKHFVDLHIHFIF